MLVAPRAHVAGVGVGERQPLGAEIHDDADAGARQLDDHRAVALIGDEVIGDRGDVVGAGRDRMRGAAGPRAALRERDRADRAAEPELAIELLEAAAQRALGGGLHPGVERRVELQAAAEQVAVAVAPGRELADVLDEVRRCEVVEIALVDERDRLGERGGVLGIGDVAVLAHMAEHVALAFAREREVVRRRVLRRRRDEPGEQRSLGDREVFDVFAEVGLGRRANAVGAVTEIDVIEIDRQDLGLGELALEAHREDQLARLAAVLEELLLLGDALGRPAELVDRSPSSSASSVCLMICCVSVEPPCLIAPSERKLVHAARAMPSMSKPPCL